MNKNKNIDKNKNLRKKYGSKTSRPLKPESVSDNKNSKRRGRRPKKILENVNTSVDEADNTTNETKNDSAIILKLKIDPAKLDINKDTKEKEKKEKEKDESNSENSSSEGMFRNDIPNDNICFKCAKNEKALAVIKSKLDKYEKKNKLDKISRIHYNKLDFISYTTGKKINIKKTGIRCWWDTHKFNTLPCFLPELFHNGTYHVTGCFCSFNCALAYNLYYLKDSKIYHRKSLTHKLYREMHGLTPDDLIEIKEAPRKEILDDYGGDMTIEEFRASFDLKNEYTVFIPPLRPINMIIEERNTHADDDNDKDFVLKRNKPLTKKGSIISSMKIKMNDDF